MSLRSLLTLSGGIEVLVGLLTVFLPAVTIALLLGGPADASAELMARLFGAGVLALGLAGIKGRDDLRGCAGLALAYGFTCYNVVAGVLLLWAGAGLHLGGAVLWVAAIAHAVLGVLFVYALVAPRAQPHAGESSKSA